MQPISFTNPPVAPEPPDTLPNICSGCKAFLPPNNWGQEEDFEIIEINGRDREVKLLVFTTACERCGKFFRRTFR